MSMASILSSIVSLLLVTSAASSIVQQTRQSNFRSQRSVGQQLSDNVHKGNAVAAVKTMEKQPEVAEQETLTREDMLQQNAQQNAPQGPPQQAVHAAPVNAQQLLQAQALQMQQMKQQLRQQQQELQRLQKTEKQRQQQPRQPPAAPKPPQQRQEEAPKKSLVGVGTKVMTKTEMQSGSSGVARPKGWDQCLKFARFVKTQDVTGLELVRVWKSTCEPAVQSGRATERYKLMCNSLSGVIQPYSAQIDYDVEQLCDSVLAVFHDVTAVDAKAR